MKFDPAKNTYGEIFKAADKVNSVADAQEYLKGYAEFIHEKNDGRYSLEEAYDIARGNIGYLLGYGACNKACEIWSEAKAAHPIFGDPKGLASISPGEALSAGYRAGKEKRR